MTMCENCGTPYLNDRKKIIYQDMEFCEIECFLNSKHFDGEELDVVKAAKEDYEEALNDFKKSEDEKATAETLNAQLIAELEELETKYDDKFKKGNLELDEILIKINEVKENNKI